VPSGSGRFILCAKPVESPCSPHTDAEGVDFLDAHNAVRAGASPTPRPALTPLTWLGKAASVARG